MVVLILTGILMEIRGQVPVDVKDDENDYDEPDELDADIVKTQDHMWRDTLFPDANMIFEQLYDNQLRGRRCYSEDDILNALDIYEAICEQLEDNYKQNYPTAEPDAAKQVKERAVVVCLTMVTFTVVRC